MSVGPPFVDGTEMIRYPHCSGVMSQIQGSCAQGDITCRIGRRIFKL